MVYAGPRKGCQNCKRRHIRCDGGTPTCANCHKRSDVCTGFKDDFDAVFRDESSKVSEKAQRKQSAVTIRQSKSPSPSTITQKVIDGRQAEALCFFFDTYVDVQRHPHVWRGFLELLIPVYAAAKADTPVIHAAAAVSVFLQEAWAANMPENDRTRKFYGRALKSMTKAINDPKESTKDETLMAVMLLEMYDTIAHAMSSQAVTGTHHRGAVALVKHRGKLNYMSEISRRLLVAVRHEVLSEANRENFTIDRANDEIWSDGDGSVEMPTNPAIELDIIRIDHVNFKAAMQGFDDSNIQILDQQKYLSSLAVTASVLDSKLEGWYASLPGGWLPTTVAGPECIPQSVKRAGVYGSSCDIYCDVLVASVINNYRCIRVNTVAHLIRLCSMLHRDDGTMNGQWQHEENVARSNLQRLVDDFCNSVPFHLGNRISPENFDDPDLEYPYLPGDKSRNRVNSRQATAMGGWFMLAPLRSILKSLESDKQLLRQGQWQWIAKQLYRVASIYALKKGNNDSFEAPIPVVADESYINQEGSFEIGDIGLGFDP